MVNKITLTHNIVNESNTGATDGKQSNISTINTDPNRVVTGGGGGGGDASYARRRSSQYVAKHLQSSRRLSVISGHSMAVALDIKRKSIGGHSLSKCQKL